MLLRKVTLAILFLNFSAIAIGQPGDVPPNAEPGKCYAKCLMPPEYDKKEEVYTFFIGEKNSIAKFDSIYLRMEEATGELIYLGKLNKLSAKDKREIADLEKIVFVVNPEEVNETIEETINFKRKRPFKVLEWKEVLCNDRINRRVIKGIELFLIKEVYLNYNSPKGQLTNEVKIALRQYQEENKLPIGNIDIETLETMDLFF